MAKYKKIEEGICPVCGKTILGYGELELEDDLIFYPWTCEHCGASGEEWYTLSFAGHNVYTEDGKDILDAQEENMDE